MIYIILSYLSFLNRLLFCKIQDILLSTRKTLKRQPFLRWPKKIMPSRAGVKRGNATYPYLILEIKPHGWDGEQHNTDQSKGCISFPVSWMTPPSTSGRPHVLGVWVFLYSALECKHEIYVLTPYAYTLLLILAVRTMYVCYECLMYIHRLLVITINFEEKESSLYMRCLHFYAMVDGY